MTNNERLTKNERRAHARDLARERAEADRRRKRRNRWFLQGGIGIGILAIAAIIALVAINVNSTNNVSAAGPKNMITGGIQFHGVNGKVEPVTTASVPPKGTPSAPASKNADRSAAVVEYIDWACPVCKSFEGAYSAQILDLVKSGKATLQITPVSILDRNYQNSRYASRAANAAACVANYAPDKFLAVQSKFYDNQPTEGSSGLTNAQIADLVKQGGATGKDVSSCLSSEQFRGWVTKNTASVVNQKALQGSQGFGTPTVVVNGQRLDDLTQVVTKIGEAAS